VNPLDGSAVGLALSSLDGDAVRWVRTELARWGHAGAGRIGVPGELARWRERAARYTAAAAAGQWAPLYSIRCAVH